jgi:hypothetical protein
VCSFVELILKLAVIRYFANRWVRRWRDFHQIQSTFTSQAQRFEWLHHTQLPAFFVNHPNFASANSLVDAGTVGLPEIPICDKSP